MAGNIATTYYDPSNEGIFNDKVLHRLARKVGVDWKEIGIELDFSMAEIQQIRDQVPATETNYLVAITFEIFRKWRTRKKHLSDEEKYNALKGAFQEIDRESLVYQLDQLVDISAIKESDIEEKRSECSRITASDSKSDVSMASPNSRSASQLLALPSPDTVTVSINNLSFFEDSPVYTRDDVSKLFVEYRFLDIPPEQTETPYALPKPPPNKDINFNFTNVFHVDFKDHYVRRQYLASMLLPEDPLDGKIKLTVVSEPEDEEGDCEDVGKAYVSVRDIVRTERDLEEQDIDIVNPENAAQVIGKINVTVKVLEALKAVQAEITKNLKKEKKESSMWPK